MSMTPGNKLYLYSLLSREIGVGRQTMLSRVEEVLVADDLMPSDVGCADVRELMESLDFVRLTVFKRGRAYVTLLEQPEWDELLKQAASASERKSAAPAGGGHKSWKRKRGAKALRPEKPRPHGRPKEVAEPQDAPAASPAVEAPDAGGAEVAKTVVAEAPADAASTVKDAPSVAAADVAAADASADEEVAATEEAPAAPEAAAEALTPAAQTATEEEAPVVEEAPAIEEAPVVEEAPAIEEAPVSTTPNADAEHAEKSGDTEVPAASPDADEPTSEEEHAPAVFPSGGGISFTVTYDPATDAPSAQAAEGVPRHTASTRPASAYRAPTHPIPHDFAAEVWCPNDQLSLLYQVLPLDVNPLTLLAEDWAVARSTQTYERTAAGVTYPLRCLGTSADDKDAQADGVVADAQDAREDLPVRATIRRRPANATGKRWQLASIDGDLDAILADFSVLRAADEGAWADLDGRMRDAFRPTSPLRDLAQFALLWPLPERLAELAELAEPEPWGNDFAGLRDYLAVTFVRVRHQDKLAIANDGSRAAFDTGLFAPTGERIFACFTACSGDVAWQLEGFSTDCGLAEAPEPASYVSAWEDLCLAAPYTVHLSRTLRRTYAEALDDAIARSVVRARRNHRVATPAWDPQTGELRLLLPLATERPDLVDAALVLARLAGEGYEARAILSLERARTCARIVTAELPSWLEA